MTRVSSIAPRIACLLFATLAGTHASWGAGDIDPTFGESGTSRYRSPEWYIQAVVPLPTSGFLIVSTNGDNCCTPHDLVVRRIDADGRLDPSFGEGGTVALPDGYELRATALDPGMRLIVAGSLEHSPGGGFVAAITSDGRLDPSFGPSGLRLFPGAVTGLAVQPDGRIVLTYQGKWAQEFGSCKGSGWSMVRLSAHGEPDPSFGSGGLVTWSAVEGADSTSCELSFLWTQADGRIVVPTGRGTRRLEPNGILDATFGKGSEVPTPFVQVTRNPDDSFAYILEDGDLRVRRAVLARFDRDGNRIGTDVNLPLTSRLTGRDSDQENTGVVASTVSAGDGRHYYVAFRAVRPPENMTGIETELGRYVARLQLDGTLDATFGFGGFVKLDGPAQRIVPLGDGRLLVASFGDLYRLRADTPTPVAPPPGGAQPPPAPPQAPPPAVQPTSGSGGGGANGPLEAILLAAMALSGLSRRRRLPLPGIVVATLLASPSAAIAAGKIDTTFADPGSYTVRIPGGAVMSVTPLPNGKLLLLTLTGDNCCSGFSLVLGRTDSDGRLEPSVDGFGREWEIPFSLDGIVSALDSRQRMLVGGSIDDAGGGGFLVALGADGRPDPDFAEVGIRRFPTNVTAIATQADGRILVATEGTWAQDSGGQPICTRGGWSIHGLTLQGTDDPAFGNAGVTNAALATGGSGTDCIASHLWTQADARIIVASGAGTLRLASNGLPDPSFGAGSAVPPLEVQATRNPDGSFAYLLTDEDWMIGSAMLARFDRNGVRLGADLNLQLTYRLTGYTDVRDDVVRLSEVVAGDGSHYYVAFRAVRKSADGHRGQDSILGSYIVRLRLDGTLDPTFGNGGMARIGFEQVRQLVPLEGGRLLVVADHRLFRLTGADEPSPGLVKALTTNAVIDEPSGVARIVVSRVLGADGRIAVRYATRNGDALEGSDFRQVSGTLEWADGDSSDRTIEIPIIDDSNKETGEFFQLDFAPSNATTAIADTLVWISVVDNDSAPPPPQPPPVTAPTPPAPNPPSAGGSGGGGGIDPGVVALLAGLLAAMSGRTAISRRRPPSRTATAAARPSGTSP